MKSYREWSMVTKIMLPVAVTCSLTIGMLALGINWKSSEALQMAAERELSALAEGHAASVQEFLGVALEPVRGLAAATSTAISQKQFFSRAQFIAMLQGLVDSRKNFIAAGCTFIPDGFNGPDAAWGNTPGSLPSGQFSPYIVDGKVTTALQSDQLYTKTRDRGLYLSAPYAYPVNGRSILITTAAAAVKDNNQYRGTILIDIPVEAISDRIGDITIFKTGRATLVSSTGSIVAHRDKTNIGKQLKDASLQIAPQYLEKLMQSNKPELLRMATPQGMMLIYNYPVELQSGQIWHLLLNVLEVEVLEASYQLSQFVLISGVSLLLVSLLIVYLVVRRCITPLSYMAGVAEKIANGEKDLNIDDSKFGGEVLTLHKSLFRMLMALESNINNAHEMSREAQEQSVKAEQATAEAQSMRTAAENAKREGMLAAAARLEGVVQILSGASRELSVQILQSERGAVDQAARIADTATAMEQMNAAVVDVARNATIASDASVSTRNEAVAGATIVHEAVTGIQAVRAQALKLRDDMCQLDVNAKAISDIMSVISDIADQTNLLALNAAIEAARAGDAGRGFAVVADEVRKLAEKTMISTVDVGKAISAIQASTAASMAQVETSAQAIEDATGKVNRSGSALESIASLVDRTSEQVRSIATASEEQAASSESINLSLNQVNDIASETTDAMRSASQAVAELVAQSEELSRLIEQMKKG